MMVSKWKGWHLNPESLNPKVMHDSVLPFPWLHFSSSWNTISFLIKVVWIRFQVLVVFFKSRWIQSQWCKLNLNILIPTPSSSHRCSNWCNFPLNSFRQMSSDSIPLESTPATSPAYCWDSLVLQHGTSREMHSMSMYIQSGSTEESSSLGSPL